MPFAGLNRNKEENKEESTDPEDPDDDVPLARLVTASSHILQNQWQHMNLSKMMQTYLTGKSNFFAEIRDKTNNGNESDKENEEEKTKQRKK